MAGTKRRFGLDKFNDTQRKRQGSSLDPRTQLHHRPEQGAHTRGLGLAAILVVRAQVGSFF
jgi:hypothetical protein